jgi:hypothetical protein
MNLSRGTSIVDPGLLPAAGMIRKGGRRRISETKALITNDSSWDHV